MSFKCAFSSLRDCHYFYKKKNKQKTEKDPRVLNDRYDIEMNV